MSDIDKAFEASTRDLLIDSLIAKNARLREYMNTIAEYPRKTPDTSDPADLVQVICFMADTARKALATGGE